MAIIVLQHTVADNFLVDPDWSVSVDGSIYAGSLVGLDATGYVKLAGLTDPLGVAGDSIADEYKTTAYSAELIISPTGAKRWTQNRVENYFNETLASGKMTVYTTGGLFGTTEYDTAQTYVPGTKLYSTSAGKFTNQDGGSARIVGYVSKAPNAYPSGVPGVDSPAVENSMSLGTYLFVQLSI